jgi:hypothetical protein
VVDALRILFSQIVKSPWDSEFPWDMWKEPHLHFPDQLEQFDQVGRHIPVSGGSQVFADSRPVTTSGPCRSCWGMRTFPRQ